MNQIFFRFDNYIISKMLEREWENAAVTDFSESCRYQAYHIFLKRTAGHRIAAYQTIQKWFGIHGWSRPNREKIFELNFALGSSQQEVREMLVKGAQEPDFQINDYREMIFLYGFGKGMSYQDCLDMIEEFEYDLPTKLQLLQHNHTTDMWKGYGDNCYLDREGFLAWMLERSEEFKGYSKTVLGYFLDLKWEILEEIKQDATKHLEELLGESGFLLWEKNRHLGKHRRKKTIPRYLQESRGKISEELAKTIEELLQMAEVPLDSNKELLVELYADIHRKYRKPGTRHRRGELRLLDDKYLSDLLNVGYQKEKLMKLILQEPHNKEEREKRSYAIREQRRRCLLLERQDILPLIHCVSQKRYMRRLEKEKYSADKAKEQFIALADRILAACQMVPVDEKRYELDALLCSCYEQEDMCSLPEALEEYLR